VLELRPDLRVFRDRESLRVGADIMGQLDRAIRSTQRFVPLYSEAYLASNACADEFNSAWNIRQGARRDDLLFPIALGRIEQLDPRMAKTLYRDCGASGTHTIHRAAEELFETLPR
jgi:hypothetical protein